MEWVEKAFKEVKKVQRELKWKYSTKPFLFLSNHVHALKYQIIYRKAEIIKMIIKACALIEN